MSDLSSLENSPKISRRAFLAGLAGAAAVALGIKGAEVIGQTQLTPEQKLALGKYNLTPDNELVRGLQVKEGGTNFRTSPTTWDDGIPGVPSNIAGQYEAGRLLPGAMRWEGDNPETPGHERNAQARQLPENRVPWYFVPTEYKDNKATNGVFIFAGNAEQENPAK